MYSPGIDTVTVIFENAYGADTATAVISVTDCGTVAVFPWDEPFDGYNHTVCCEISGFSRMGRQNMMWGCWVDLTPYGGQTVRLGFYSRTNAWLVTPELEIPTATGGLNLDMWVHGGPIGWLGNIHYSAFTLPSGIYFVRVWAEQGTTVRRLIME